MSKEYEVGYKKPPKHTRFKPGKSGNPRGRPKVSDDPAAPLERVFRKKIIVKEGDRVRHMEQGEAMLQSQMVKAIKGDTKAAEMLLREGRLAGILVAPEPVAATGEPPRGGVLVVPGITSIEDWAKVVDEHQRRFRGNGSGTDDEQK